MNVEINMIYVMLYSNQNNMLYIQIFLYNMSPFYLMLKKRSLCNETKTK